MKRVVLVRPSGPRNAGMALRAVANFGPAELWIVAPARPSLLVHPEFEQMAHGAAAARARVVVAAELRAALAETTWSVGFTARVRDHRFLRNWAELAGELGQRAADPDERVALVFGSEESGLSIAECDQVAELAHIETSAEHRSLNLAMAVTLVLHSLYTEPRGRPREGTRSPLVGVEREFLVRHVADVLSGAALSAQVAGEIEASVERVFARAPLETRDAGAWHAVMRALGNRKTPRDYGLAGSEKDARAPLGDASD